MGTTITLSSNIELTFNSIPQALAQDLIVQLMEKQIMSSDGTVMDTDDVDNMKPEEQVKLLHTITDIIQDILLEPGVVDVKMPPKSKWLPRVVAKSYVRDKIDMFKSYGIDPLEDKDMLRFLYIRYVAVQDSADLNTILENTILAADVPVET